MPESTEDKAARWNGSRILVGSQMDPAFEAGVSYYKPVYPGSRLHPEGGVTQFSLENLRKLRSRIAGAELVAVHVGQDCVMKFVFEGFTYIATGFGLGYGGEGPRGLADILSECGVGSVEALRGKISVTPSEFRGELLASLKKPSC